MIVSTRRQYSPGVEVYTTTGLKDGPGYALRMQVINHDSFPVRKC